MKSSLVATVRFLLLALAAVGSQAATLYVATTGSDTAAGTQAQPLATLSRAITLVKAGDTIQMGAGTFTGSANTSVAGASGARITVQGAGQGVTFLNGAITVDQPYYTFSNFSCTGGYIKNFVLTSAANYTILENITSSRAVRFVDLGTADHCVVRNCDISHWFENGVINLSGDDNLVENNRFHDGTEGTDVIRANNMTNCTVRGNTFENLFTPGTESGTSTDTIDVTVGTKTLTTQAGFPWVGGGAAAGDRVKIESGGVWLQGFITSYNSTTGALVFECDTENSSGTFSSWTVALSSKGNHADIIQAFGNDNADPLDQPAKGFVFERNLIRNSDTQWGNLSTDGETNIGDWTFRNNVTINSRIQFNLIGNVTPFSNPPYDIKFYNNTFYNWSGTSGTEGTKHFNNIYCRMGAHNSAGAYSPYNAPDSDADYNLMTYYGTDGPKTAYVETHGINGGYTPNQIFVDPVNGDFRLKTGSPAIGRGLDLSTIAGFNNDFIGAPRAGVWDMGAFSTNSITTAPSNARIGIKVP